MEFKINVIFIITVIYAAIILLAVIFESVQEINKRKTETNKKADRDFLEAIGFKKNEAITLAFFIETRLSYYENEDTFTKQEILDIIEEILEEDFND